MWAMAREFLVARVSRDDLIGIHWLVFNESSLNNRCRIGSGQRFAVRTFGAEGSSINTIRVQVVWFDDGDTVF